MGRVVKSQWEFGDLFEQPPSTRQVLSVSELTGAVRRVLERELRQIWVTGEISNFRIQNSGHIYFSLKDAQAQLQCVLFRGERVANRQLLQDGQKVVLFGDVTVYEPRGQYQLRVLQVELHGLGALQAAFEQLKRKLQAEGLFAQERKRPLPAYPRRIGLVTSSTGAAIQDVLHVLGRRHPFVEIFLAQCRVQGDGAAAEIACAIRLLNQWSQNQPSGQGLDLVLVTRGGGSLEDLWAFNEEIVARAVFESALPIVSAVGHEIDFTICDFVADLRAATPSAAAEIISEAVNASREYLCECLTLLPLLLARRLQRDFADVKDLVARLQRVHPRRFVETNQQLLDELDGSLRRSIRRGWRDEQIRLGQLRKRMSLLKPSALVRQRKQLLSDLIKRLREVTRSSLERQRVTCRHLEDRVRLLGPEGTLARGYSITTDEKTGAILRASSQTRPGQRVRTRLQTGVIRSVVEPDDGKSTD